MFLDVKGCKNRAFPKHLKEKLSCPVRNSSYKNRLDKDNTDKPAGTYKDNMDTAETHYIEADPKLIQLKMARPEIPADYLRNKRDKSDIARSYQNSLLFTLIYSTLYATRF